MGTAQILDSLPSQKLMIHQAIGLACRYQYLSLSPDLSLIWHGQQPQVHMRQHTIY
jgi:hypothetical protein